MTRHTQSAKHEQPHPEYTSLTPKGVEQARERAHSEIFKIVQDAPVGTVIFIGGGSLISVIIGF